MISSGHVLLKDTYSHTAFGTFWPNHEWLAEVYYYAAYRLGGLPLVTLSAAALIVAAWAFVWRLTQGPVRLRFILTACALVPASLHWEPRPHAFSLLFLMLTVYLLLTGRHWWLPLVFLVWANCHGGVLIGLVILSVGLGVAAVETPRLWWEKALVLCSSVAAATLTPLGSAFWTEVPRSLARIRLYPLDEWQPPRVTDLRLLPFWIIAVALCLALLWGWRRLRVPIGRTAAVTLCACAVVLLPLAVGAVRNVGLFLMVAVPALSLLVGDHVRVSPAHRERPVLNLLLIASAVLIASGTIVGAYALRIDHLQWTPLPPASVAALDRCSGNLYNRYDEGGYLIWFARNHPVFLDGRQDPYDPALVLEQIRIEATGDYESAFRRYGIRCAYIPTGSVVATKLTSVAWKPLYQDSRWVVLAEPAGGAGY
jgi:hypothetical protein